ncbi:MAG: hypothetical protein LC118_11325 [Dehalococcoidia bacterium]|nr:hypothetical protein [Dehalococcoidia bacterium]
MARPRRTALSIALVLAMILGGSAGGLFGGDTARASSGSDTWQGWFYTYYGDQISPPPPGMWAYTNKAVSSYTHPCVYASFKIGSTWYPQGTTCAAPYGTFVDIASGSAICVYGEHWLKDAVNADTPNSTYYC